MDYLFRANKYLAYWLDKVNEHSLHSPFLFDLYTKVIKPNGHAQFHDIENLRQQLLKNNDLLSYQDPGQGNMLRKRRIREIAKNSLSDPKFSSLYYRLIQYFKPSEVIELGTSMGINTMYLAKAGVPVFTFEGAPELAVLSKNHFQELGFNNISVIEGNIDKTLPAFLENRKNLQFIFIDANHTYEGTMQYFHRCLSKAIDGSIFIFDDIYWSKAMGSAWQEIKAHPDVTVTLDLYRCGIVVFNKSLTPHHYALKF